MRAGVFEKKGIFKIKDWDEPKIKFSDDVKIKVEVAGLCGTDAHIVSVPQMHPAKEGIILGHEFVGRIVDIGDQVYDLKIGDRVIAGPNIWCGQCQECRCGRKKLCLNNQALGITRDGGFAEYVVAPARAFYPVPNELTAEQAVFAEPLSCILNGFERLGTSFGDKVVVLGTGPIGLYFIRLFKYFGANKVYATEPDENRFLFAKKMGADKVFQPESFDDELKNADIVIDTTGFLLKESLQMTRSGGRVLLFGLDDTCECHIRPYDIVKNEKSIFGCFVDNDKIPRSLELISKLNLENLISHRYSLEQLSEALEVVAKNKGIKVLVYPEGI